MNSIEQHKKLFFTSLGLILVLVIIPLLLILSSPSRNPGGNIPITPTILERHAGFTLASFSPLPTTPLEAGKIANFTVTFNETLSSENLTSVITETPIGTTNAQTLTSFVSFDETGRTVIITPKSPFKENSSYQVLLKKSKDNTVLFTKLYFTISFTPTPLPSNNQLLAQYLPYKTDRWMLSYDKNRNLYYFNMLLDPNSPVDFNTQFENAQKEALDFIKGKGIEVNTLTIEWKR